MSNNPRNDILFICLLIFFILLLGLFNFIVDPYHIFRKTTYIGFNNQKIHQYSDKRKLIFSDIKINSKDKNIVFTGNCLLSDLESSSSNVIFFTLPIVKISEVSQLIVKINKLEPNIKTFYWGLFYDDFFNDYNPLVNSYSINFENLNFTLEDIVNLFFSWNTTKYSIETIISSIKYKNNNIKYIYPYRELYRKEYKNKLNFENLNCIRDVSEWAKQNGINLILYYSPIHISKKIYLYNNGQWENYQNLKKELSKITSFYDFSLPNKYNNSVLDENNKNFIDNIHPSIEYNKLLVKDLLKNDEKFGILINQNNIDSILIDDTKFLTTYIQNNKEIADSFTNFNHKDISFKLQTK